VELGAGTEHPKKVMELRRVFTQLTGCPIKNLGAPALNHVHGLILNRCHGAQSLAASQPTILNIDLRVASL